MRRPGTVFVVCTAMAAGGGLTSGDVLLEQPHDHLDRVISFEVWPYGGGQVGDDYRTSRPIVIGSVTFWMIVKWPEVPFNWSFNVHRTTTEHPLYDSGPEYDHFFRRTGADAIDDRGPWNGDETRHLFVVRFDDLSLALPKGVYWFSPEGHIFDQNLSMSYWGTAGNGQMNGDEGWWKEEPWDWPGWRPLSSYGLKPSDYAMRIEGRSYAAATATEVATEFGFIFSGGLDELAEPDGETIHARSFHWLAAEAANLLDLRVAFESVVDEPESLTVVVESFINQDWPAGEMEVRLKNWMTGAFDVIDTYAITSAPERHASVESDPSHYVRAHDGRVEVSVKASTDAPASPTGFDARFDWVQVLVAD